MKRHSPKTSSDRELLSSVLAIDHAFHGLDEAAKSVSEYSDGTTDFGRDAGILADALNALGKLGFGSVEEALEETVYGRCE